MKTFLLVLRLGFWTNPLQRLLVALSALGTIFAVPWRYFAVVRSLEASNIKYGTQYKITPGDFLRDLLGLDESKWVVISVAAICLLMGSVYWRIASAPRIVRLAPHGRTRLLGSFLAVVLLVALLSTATRWLELSGLLLIEWRPVAGPHDYGILTDMIICLLVVSLVVAGQFVACRSPLAALVVLIALLSPPVTEVLYHVWVLYFVWPMYGVGPNWAASIWVGTGREVVPLLAVVWIPLSLWYLRARRISPPGWLAGGSQDVLATTLVSSATPRSRDEALQRQLLGGTTFIRFGVQWFVILGFLLGVQWSVSRMTDGDTAFSALVMYASLCICPVVTTVVSFAAIRRSRALWLLAASTRAEFYGCVERILVRLNLGMALVFAIWLAVLWFTQSWRPGAAEDQLAVALVHVTGLWLAGLFAIYSQLAGWPKWFVATIVAAMLICMWLLTTSRVASPREEASTVLTVTLLLIAIPVVGLALRWQAQRRWREGDFPRAVTSTASGT